MKEAGEKGLAGSWGNRAALTSISSSSSLGWSDCDFVLTSEALLEKKEKRLAIAGFAMICAADCCCRRLEARRLDGSAMVSNGLRFSFVGDGIIPRLIGSDSPVNQSASFPAFASGLLVRIENLFDRAGDDCRDCCGEGREL